MGKSHLYLHNRRCKDGTHIVYLYAPMDVGAPARITTGRKVLKSRWHPDGYITGSARSTKRENLILQGKVSLANMIIQDYELRGIELRKDIFEKEFKNPISREDFTSYLEQEVLGDFDQGHFGMGVRNMKLRTVRKLREYKDPIKFADFSREFLVDFDRWHALKLQAKGYDGKAERIRAMKHIKEYLTRAREDKNLKLGDPFKNFKWPKYAVKREFLTEEEVFLLLDFYQDPDEILKRMEQAAKERDLNPWNAKKYASSSGVKRIRQVLQIFLFQCLSGLRYGDTQRLVKSHIHGNHIVFYPEKTVTTSGKMVKILITPVMKSLMNKGSAQLLPRISNTKYNDYIKEACTLAGLDKEITTHIGRHTFATMFSNRGGSILALRDLLGLTKLETVLSYYHVTEAYLDQEMERVFGDFQKERADPEDSPLLST